MVPYPPGGGTDILGRLMAQRLSERLASPVLVENRGGAGGNIGAQTVANARRMATRCSLTGNNLAINGSCSTSNPGYDSPAGFRLRGAGGEYADPCWWSILAVPATDAGRVHRLCQRQNQGRLNHGPPGSGTRSTLAGALFD